MATEQITLVIEVDTSKWDRAMAGLATKMLKLARRAAWLHQRWHATRPDPRCAICHPRANPRPLCVDGHEYARRRRSRARRRRRCLR